MPHMVRVDFGMSNGSYISCRSGGTICAERTAFVKAVVSGQFLCVLPKVSSYVTERGHEEFCCTCGSNVGPLQIVS